MKVITLRGQNHTHICPFDAPHEAHISAPDYTTVRWGTLECFCLGKGSHAKILKLRPGDLYAPTVATIETTDGSIAVRHIPKRY